ncbi:MAG: hypothetical protein AAF570_05390 [Bacteroidota bacterium]
MRILTIFLCIILFAAACTSEQKPSESPQNPASTTNPTNTPPPSQPKKDFPKGTVVLDEPVTAAGEYSYALYLPIDYTHKEKWPVVFYFDSHADGEYPVRSYAVAAETYGFVLVGSNSSKNGIDVGYTRQIYDLTRTDVFEKLSLDKDRVYLSGFSGGARVAADAAQAFGNAAGVIGCAAGYQPQSADAFDYFGIVGVRDFNYLEMRNLDAALDGATRQPHMVDYFSGGHEWPPLSFMTKALQWMNCRAMVQGVLPRQDDLLADIETKFRRQLKDLDQGGTPYQRHRLYEKYMSFTTGLLDQTQLQAELDALIQSGKANPDHARHDELAQRELSLRQTYAGQLQSNPDPSYWSRTAGMLWKIARSNSGDESWLHHRILGFLSLSTYMQVNGALNQRALPQADALIQIYAEVDPRNSEHAYMRAQWHMLKEAPEKALQALNAAAALGFDDAERLRADPRFAKLSSDPRFEDFIKGIE